MAKKFVRGITDVKTINNQDFDTNNVNDLLSDGQYNYIHRKKGKSEEYHNLTDNIKTISSDNTELLSVTNNNKTTNTATLHPKHDSQKEQLLESTRNTVTIHHGENGTAEKTTVDTNPQKVLEHENLKTGDGLTTSFNTDETTIMFKATKKPPEANLNTLGEGVIYGKGFSLDQVPNEDQANSAAYVTMNTDENTKVQLYIRESSLGNGKIRLYHRFIINGEVTEWKQMAVDRDELNNQLAQKQNKLIAGDGITIEGQTVDTNPQKVLEHENLISNSQYVTIEHEQDSNTSEIKTDNLVTKLDELDSKIPKGIGVRNLLEKTNQGKTNWSWATPNSGATVEDYDVDGVNAVKMTYTTSESVEWSYIGYWGLITNLIEPNTKYTLSFDIKPSVDVTLTASLKLSNNSAPITDVANMNKALANQWTKVSCVLTSNNSLADTSDQLVYFKGMPTAKDNYLIIKNIKLEKGVVPSDWSPAPEDIYLTSLNDYSEDLNNLTYTCTAKPIDNTPNLPTGVYGHGILTVTRIGDVVSQTYHALDNNVYYRITNNSSSTFVWTPWVKVTSLAV